MKALNMITCILVIVGAINWGLVGAFHFNLVDFLFSKVPYLVQIIYIRVIYRNPPGRVANGEQLLGRVMPFFPRIVQPRDTRRFGRPGALTVPVVAVVLTRM